MSQFVSEGPFQLPMLRRHEDLQSILNSTLSHADLPSRRLLIRWYLLLHFGDHVYVVIRAPEHDALGSIFRAAVGSGYRSMVDILPV